MTFKATLSAAVSSNVVLGWSTGNDDTAGARQATAGTDYTAVSGGSVTIAANSTEATFTVSRQRQDTDTEGDETFKVTITGTTLPAGVTIGTASADRHDHGRRRGDGGGGRRLRDRGICRDLQGDAVRSGQLQRGAGLVHRQRRHRRSAPSHRGRRLHGGVGRQRDDRGQLRPRRPSRSPRRRTPPPRATRPSRSRSARRPPTRCPPG